MGRGWARERSSMRGGHYAGRAGCVGGCISRSRWWRGVHMGGRPLRAHSCSVAACSCYVAALLLITAQLLPVICGGAERAGWLLGRLACVGAWNDRLGSCCNQLHAMRKQRPALFTSGTRHVCVRCVRLLCFKLYLLSPFLTTHLPIWRCGVSSTPSMHPHAYTYVCCTRLLSCQPPHMYCH